LTHITSIRVAVVIVIVILAVHSVVERASLLVLWTKRLFLVLLILHGHVFLLFSSLNDALE